MEVNYIRLKEIKPALSGYISESLTLLNRSPLPDEEAIHDIRVLMKKSRATLKLLSTEIDEELFTREYVACREAGRILGEWRDLSVQKKTLRSIRKSNRKLFGRLTGTSAVDDLLSKPDHPQVPESEVNERLARLKDIVRRSAFRIRFFSPASLDQGKLLVELEKSFDNVSGMYFASRLNPKPDRIHEFRKRAKDLLYQLYFFRPLNPPAVKAMEKRLENITQNLGKSNDLAQLVKALGYDYSDAQNSPEMNELIIVIKNLQDKYLAKVWPESFKIFCPGCHLADIAGFRFSNKTLYFPVKP